MLTKSNFRTSLFYTIFEGLSKGGSHLLLLIIASVINSDLYIKLMLIVSFEALITMLYLSYYTDVMFAFKRNKNSQFVSTAIDSTIIQLVIFVILYFLFKRSVDYYFSYNFILLSFIIFGNAALTNIIKFFSVQFQIDLKHKLAIRYKSIPFFFSFVGCLSCFFVFQDKVFGFFFGKFIGLFIFTLILYFEQKHKLKLFIFHKLDFKIFFNRAKYSFVIAMVGWGAGLGFLNFAKIYSGDKSYLLILGLVFNTLSLLQLFSNGINQVYVPNLKMFFDKNKESAIKYSHSTFLVYVLITSVFLLIVLGVLLFKSQIISHIPQLTLLLNGKYLFVVVGLFFLNAFQWVAAPYLIVSDNYPLYLRAKIFLNMIGWAILFGVYYFFGLSNFVYLYVILQAIDSIGMYICVDRLILKKIKN